MKRIISFILLAAALLSLATISYADDDFIGTEALDEYFKQYVADNSLSGNNMEFSVGFVYTKTGDEYYYNADKFMYSASLYKVPVCMLLSEKEAAGEINQQTQLVGSMTVEYLEYTALVNSNNDSGHYVADYMGEGISQYDTYSGKDADIIKKYAPDIADDYYSSDFYEVSYYTARFMTQVMKTLYEGGDEKFPHINDYLIQAQPENYYNLSLKDKYTVAQKYGAFEERNGNKDNHCAAIIYTPTPIIVVVMTKNVSAYEKVIADVGAYLANYAVSLDAKPEPTPTPEPTAEPTAQPVSTPVPIETIDPHSHETEDEESKSFPVYVLLIIPVLLCIILVLKITKKKDDSGLYDDYPEDNQEEEYGQEYSSIKKGKYKPKH